MHELLQNAGLRSYRIAKASGLLSSRLGEQFYSRAYFFYKTRMEGRQTALVRRLAQPRTLAIDAGANIGYFTAIMADAVGPAGAVVAFEPEPHNLKLLRTTLRQRQFDNVTVVASALGDRSGRAALWVNPAHPADHRMFPFEGHAGGHDVDLVTLDAFMDEKADQRGISLIKIDVQSAEPAVLRGMRRTLDRHSSAQVLLEIAPGHLTEGGSSVGELREFLTALGFAPFTIEPGGLARSGSWNAIEAAAHRDGHIDVLMSRSIPADLGGR